MPIEKLRPSFTFTENRLRELQQIVTEAFTISKINWDTHREALGEHLESEEQEHFGLTWPSKHEARRLHKKIAADTNQLMDGMLAEIFPKPENGLEES